MEKKNAITGIEKFDDTKNLIEMVDKFLNDINLRNDVMLMTCVIKNSDKFYPQMLLEQALLVT